MLTWSSLDDGQLLPQAVDWARAQGFNRYESTCAAYINGAFADRAGQAKSTFSLDNNLRQFFIEGRPPFPFGTAIATQSRPFADLMATAQGARSLKYST